MSRRVKGFITLGLPRLSWGVAVMILMSFAVVAPFCARAQKTTAPETTSETTAELPAGAMQAKATTACTECHEARIIVQQRLSKAAWTKEVDKMMKWGAVIDAADRDALIDYLSVNFAPDNPPYQPPRTAGAKAPGKSK